MSGTFVSKVGAEGQLPNSKTTLYTVPASTTAYLTHLTLFSTTAATQTVAIYLRPGATSRQIRQVTLTQNQSYDFDLRGLFLETGDLLEGSSTTASAVDYVLSLVEET